MANQLFETIKMPMVKSNVFDLSHDHKLSAKMGKLYPILVLDAIPGDKFSITAESLIRLAPLVSPVMHRMDVTMHFFFVPNRLVWENWETFITGNNILGVEPVPPTMAVNITNAGVGSLLNYMGVPEISVPNTQNINALAVATYQCVYNEYYRDQNLILPVDYQLVDGDNTANPILNVLRTRAWEHDYFTAALPFAQKGPAVDLPLEVSLDPAWSTGWPSTFMPVFREQGSGATHTGDISQNALASADGEINISPSSGSQFAYDPAGSLITNTTINDFRTSMRLQEWLEKNARGGTRYIESMLVHFGVKSSDARLNRPEYITGTKSPIVISEVLNTTGEAGQLPQGNMAGHGIGVTSGKGGSYYCEEHGYVIGIMSILPKPAYFQGLPKHFIKTDRLDYGWPTFANLGEQEILNREIYADQAPVAGDLAFGYIPRFSEYKYLPSRVSGQFQSTLDFWHMARRFTTPPQLNSTFIECDPTRDVFAVTDPDEDILYCHVYLNIKAVRKLPKFGTPTF